MQHPRKEEPAMSNATPPATPADPAPPLLADAAQRAAYRDYDNHDNPGAARVREFYRNNHTHQT
jgi:inositol oxygenase